MPYITPYQYYENNGNIPEEENWGSYQYTSLADIVNNFMLMYVGNDKQINNVKRYEVIFHAKQAIKMLNFDALRSIRVVEMNVDDTLKFILPSDYVNYIRISINNAGILRPLYENRKANSADGYLQDSNNRVLFDVNGDIMIGTSNLDFTRVNPTVYTGPGPWNGYFGWFVDDIWYFGYRIGPRYGRDPQDLIAGPSFRINNGVIDFSSGAANQLIVIEYISDGMANGNDAEVMVNKMAEEFVYRYIKWAFLNNKYGVTLYDKKLARDEKQAELRNAKIRMSNMHPSRLLMAMREKGKWIK